MKFDEATKQRVLHYLLEKIEQETPSISKHVAEAFHINQNTVHKYINELLELGVIERISRGKYRLTEREAQLFFHRSAKELESEDTIYKNNIRPYVQDFSQNVQQIWEYTFGEMMNNAIDHSEAETVGVFIRQNYLWTWIWIIDNGIGIFRKIKDYFVLDSLEEAICELMKGKLTTDASKHSGEGIFFSSKIMDFFAISSDQKIFACQRLQDDFMLDLPMELPSGTVVSMKLSNFTHKQTRDVFDQYSSIEEGFTKTKLMLRNAFDSAPISRSQAKRVCNRLDKFQEVELDFDGLTWMGQGFAHQIFVVFQNEHPDIRLIPVNMSDDVEKMYRHVMA